MEGPFLLPVDAGQVSSTGKTVSPPLWCLYISSTGESGGEFRPWGWTWPSVRSWSVRKQSNLAQFGDFWSDTPASPGDWLTDWWAQPDGSTIIINVFGFFLRERRSYCIHYISHHRTPHLDSLLRKYWSQFFPFCCTLKAFGFEIRRWLWDYKSDMQL